LDVTTIGSVIALVGVLSGSVVAYLGKRGENATTRMNSELDQIQEERDKLREQLTARDQKIEGLLEQRVADQVEIARLRVKVVELGGDQ
jgi:predicted  nucleic acid-binding Zn-ribbon protein